LCADLNRRTPALEVRGLSRRFGPIQALDSLNLAVYPAEVHALVGENGAGKSTLINLLAGTLQPDGGQILVNGREVKFRSAHAAASAGLAAVFQELSLVGSLSVAENIFANRQPVNAFNFIRQGELLRQTRTLLRTFEVNLHPEALVDELSVAERQVVEILKALAANPHILLLDEPTSSLTHREMEILFSLIRRLREEGKAVIYISHHLPEVLALADQVTILRDGKLVATKPRSEVDEPELVRLMVGRPLQDIYGRPGVIDRKSPPRLQVAGLSRRGGFADVALEIWPGEIVGLAGLVGAGRTELGRALFGAEPPTGGRVNLDGRVIHPCSPREAIECGIAYVTEDRKSQGLFLRHTIRDNLVAPRLERFSSPLGFLHDDRIDLYAEECRHRSQIIAPDIHQLVGRLSGGNQQKALLSAWVGIEPRLLIADEPTRGVDVGARLEIYRQLRELAARGTALLVISSDLQEILGIADRILVMRAGRIVASFDHDQATEQNVIAAALGAVAINPAPPSNAAL
jgi:ABC-type sugar transport system ATPase subunit